MKNSLLILAILAFAACHVKRVDTTEVKKRMKDYKVRRVSDADILYTAELWGQELKIAIIANPQLLCDATFQIQEVKAQALYAPFKVLDPNPKLQNLIEAYNYSSSQNLTSPYNLQQINDSTVLYTFQTKLKTAKCNPGLVLLYLPNRLILRKIQ